MRADTSAGIYSFMDIVAKQAEEYAAAHTSPMSMLLEEIELFTLTRTPIPVCSPDELRVGSCN
jgi:hypothetical protein